MILHAVVMTVGLKALNLVGSLCDMQANDLSRVMLLSSTASKRHCWCWIRLRVSKISRNHVSNRLYVVTMAEVLGAVAAGVAAGISRAVEGLQRVIRSLKLGCSPWEVVCCCQLFLRGIDARERLAGAGKCTPFSIIMGGLAVRGRV